MGWGAFPSASLSVGVAVFELNAEGSLAHRAVGAGNGVHVIAIVRRIPVACAVRARYQNGPVHIAGKILIETER
jgi:hypothetical protein